MLHLFPFHRLTDNTVKRENHTTTSNGTESGSFETEACQINEEETEIVDPPPSKIARVRSWF